MIRKVLETTMQSDYTDTRITQLSF